MILSRLLLRAAALGALLCLTSSLAFGLATRTWVSGVGDDANPCSRTAPCKTFAGAIAKTPTGGEIDVLDPGGFGGLTITKSISIEADGLIAGVLVSGTDGIKVNAPGAVVVLRGLTFEGLGSGLNGIEFDAGEAVYVEDCWINGFSTNGIYIHPSSGQSQVFISHTVVRNNSGDGILVDPSGSGTVVSVTLDDVRTENNGAVGLEADGLAGAQAIVSLESLLSAGNETGILSDGTGSTIYLSNVTLVGNVAGLSASSGGGIASFRDNRIVDNQTNGSPTSTVPEE
jgi:hypothetical protein